MNADVLVQNGKITEIAKKINEKTEKTINAENCIVMPGLVNMHTHVAMNLFRSLGEDLPLHRWLKEKIWPMEAKQTTEDAYFAARLAMVEMIKSGTTAFADMCLLGVKEIANAAKEIGVRGHISQALFDQLPGKNIKSEVKKMKENIFEADEMVCYGLGPHAPYTCSKELLEKVSEFSNKKKLKLHIHASETRKEVMDILEKEKIAPYEYLDKIGLMNERTIIGHGSWVSKREIALTGKRRTTIVQTPFSGLKLATGGLCPITEYDNAGANVCLGTDSVASNNSLNMFEEMKLGVVLQKHKYWKADVLPVQKILDFATINGAKALGISSGSLEKGKNADLVVLQRDVNITPLNDVVGNIVYSTDPSNVRDVINNGTVVLENRKMVSVDEKQIMKEAEERIKSMKKR